jgi:DNA-directed RNA polymerase subunit RPC12/RpoP
VLIGILERASIFRERAMEKFYTCVACSKTFKVLNRPDMHIYRQHEVEKNMECPYCSKTIAIVWPQDESLPWVQTEDGKPSRLLEAIQQEILGTAKQLIADRLGVLAASRKLAGLRQYVEPQIAEVLLIFVGIDSETDTVSIGAERKQWNREALLQKDQEIEEAEQFYRDSAIKAASELIRLLESPG